MSYVRKALIEKLSLEEIGKNFLSFNSEKRILSNSRKGGTDDEKLFLKEILKEGKKLELQKKKKKKKKKKKIFEDKNFRHLFI